MKDLLVLVADKDMRLSINGILKRPLSLGIRPIEFDIRSHDDHDPGCCKNGVNFLSLFTRKYHHALLIFDYEGSGEKEKTVTELQLSIEKELDVSGWDNRARVVVINPELEIWVWSDSSQVAECLGWKTSRADLDKWLIEKGFLMEGEPKPIQPKEAFRGALKVAKKQFSVDIFKQLAESVSLQRCQDPSFKRLVETLQGWFPA